MFLLPETSRSVLMSAVPPVRYVTEIKKSEREADPLSPSCAEVKNEWILTSTFS